MNAESSPQLDESQQSTVSLKAFTHDNAQPQRREQLQ
jgi:hypothetical protein